MRIVCCARHAVAGPRSGQHWRRTSPGNEHACAQVFNRDLLKDMFAEADFRKEGSLDKRALKAALSREWRRVVQAVPDARACTCARVHALLITRPLGDTTPPHPKMPAARYPKRLLRGEWRQLAALLLGVSELTMCEDIKHPKYFEVRRAPRAALQRCAGQGRH